MAQATLHLVLDQIKTLNPDELRQVSQAVQERLDVREESRRHWQFYQALISSGLVRQLRKPAATSSPQRRLIAVQGEPVSQTIIEERR